MKAITMQGYGGPDKLELTDAPEPKLGPDSVLVRAKAAGVNPVDWKIGAGYLDAVMDVHFPLIPGWDVAGVVEQVGISVTELAPGDEVIGYVRKDAVEHGTYAERVAAPVRCLGRKPTALDWRQSAGLPLTGLTAYQALGAAGARTGETILIHNASGGVGSLAVQIAAARGVRVIGTASERNHDYLRGLGAEPVTYGDGLAERVRALAPDGVDAALDFIGGDAVAASEQLVRPAAEGGRRIISIASTGVRDIGGRYVFVRPDPADLEALAELADSGKLSVHVEEALPLADAAEAWRRSMSGRTRGKIILEIA